MEHSEQAWIDALIGAQVENATRRAKEEVKNLLCRLQKSLTEQDFNLVINFVNLQNTKLVDAADELRTRKALITSIEAKLDKLEEENKKLKAIIASGEIGEDDAS